MHTGSCWLLIRLLVPVELTPFSTADERLVIRGGSPTAVPALQPCPLWEPSPPLVTPYYCRLGDLLCFVFMSA